MKAENRLTDQTGMGGAFDGRAADIDRLFAQRVRSVRIRAGYTSAEALSLMLGRHRLFVNRIERGMRSVSIGEAAALCARLGISLDVMIDPDITLETILAELAG